VVVTGIKERRIIERVPIRNYILYQNYPNPFNSATKIRFSILKRDHVKLTIYNFIGQQIAELLNEEKPVGDYEVTLTSEGLTSGVYFVQLQVGNQNSQLSKLVLIK